MVMADQSGEAAKGVGNLAGGAPKLEIQKMLQVLQKQMQEAAAQEDYKAAAKIRDEMRVLSEADPLLRKRLQIETWKRRLDIAIAAEDFEEAARCRDELNVLGPLPTEPAPHKCFSDTTTQGIRVRVRSIYVPDRSVPTRNEFFFAYRVRISNEASRSVQLLNRHWIIVDATGHRQDVRGPGVIGEQPVLTPGTSFEYTSACPLQTPSGTMEGEFEMVYVDESIPIPFPAKVGPFALNVDSDKLFE